MASGADQQGQAGQQSLPDAGSDFNAQSFLVQQILGRVRTATPVKVIAVHQGGGALAPTGTVDVQPLANMLDGKGNATPHGTIFGLIYFRLQGGVNAVIIDPAVGDIGIGLVCDRDISAVKATKAVANPGSFRRFNLADGIYIGGVLNAVPTQYVRFSDGGMELVDKNANQLTMTSAGISINGILFNRSAQVQGNLPVTGALELGGTLESLGGSTYGGNIVTAGNITSTAGTVTGATDVVGGGKSLRTHVHSGVTTGAGDTGPPV